MEPNFQIPEFFLRMKETNEFKDAVIAGGYVRDNVLGKPYSDVDVFYPIGDHIDQYSKTKKLIELFGSPEEKNMEKYNFNGRLRGKFDCKIDDFDVDFVGYALPKESFGWSLIETFTFGLEMLFTDGKELFFSKDFEYDRDNQQIRLINIGGGGMMELPYLMRRFEKIHEKYPEYRFSSDYTFERRKGAGWV
jgi:hypothetical protein